MSSKNVRAKKALRQAIWHQSRKLNNKVASCQAPTVPALKTNPEETQEQTKRKLTPSQIISHFSYQDHINREKIHTVEGSKLVEEKMQALLGYVVPIDRELGEVMNCSLEPCWWLSNNAMPK